MKRSKYITLVTKKKRGVSAELSIFKQQLISKLLIALVLAGIVAVALHVVPRAFGVTIEFENWYYSILFLIMFALWAIIILHYTLNFEPRFVICLVKDASSLS